MINQFNFLKAVNAGATLLLRWMVLPSNEGSSKR